eukprot:505294_1
MAKNSKKKKYPFHFIYSYLLVWTLFFFITSQLLSSLATHTTLITTTHTSTKTSYLISINTTIPENSLQSHTSHIQSHNMKKGNDPNGTNNTRPWTLREIYDFNSGKDLNDSYILCDNHTSQSCLKSIRQFVTYKHRHYLPCSGKKKIGL